MRNALVRLADLEVSPRAAVRHLERATDLDGTAEPLYRARMWIFGKLGLVTAVNACYEELIERLAKAGRRPEAAAVGLFRKLTR
ncbi:hypothetical protein [Actinocorallia lasiicapitis]